MAIARSAVENDEVQGPSTSYCTHLQLRSGDALLVRAMWRYRLVPGGGGGGIGGRREESEKEREREAAPRSDVCWGEE
jgi:hypothetical protein